MKQPITRIRAKNFRSLGDVDVHLSPLTVLIGPNGSGKTNLLNALRFVATTARFDLAAALDEWRGFDHIQRQSAQPGPVEIALEGEITPHASSNARDEYMLTLRRGRGRTISRSEEFAFKRTAGRGRRIKVSGSRVDITDANSATPTTTLQLATAQTTALATLPKFSDAQGGQGIRQFTEFLSNIRVLEPNVNEARRPSRQYGASLASDASNLADALLRIQNRDPDAFALLVDDVQRCLPGLRDIRLVPVGGSADAVAVQLVESGLRTPIDLADASFGSVRALALFAALHEPDPAPFLAIEEVDHGLHPYALDVLADRLRAASGRMQILAATHSPTLVNRLRPHELIICDRDPKTGESVIPAISAEKIESAIAETEWQAGELWFNGVIRGIPA
jgi:predicted ATPase